MTKLTKKDVEIEIICETEYDGPEGSFDTGDSDLDNQICKEIREKAQYNEWAWCSVCVRVTKDGFLGEDYLGGCSYDSEEDFVNNSGYFDSMVSEAIRDLEGAIEKQSQFNFEKHIEDLRTELEKVRKLKTPRASTIAQDASKKLYEIQCAFFELEKIRKSELA